MSDLKSLFLEGVFYTAIAKYSGIAINIIITAILARLILPEDFGVIAVSTIFINFFSILTTVGISPAIIQNRTLDKEDIKDINSITIILAFIVTGLYCLSIPLFIQIYSNNEILKQVLYILSINVFFSISSVVPNALILKDKLFKFISVRTITIQFFLGIISIYCAYSGLGIYSLLINPVVGSFVLFIVNFAVRPIGIKFRIDPKPLQELLSFITYQTLFNVVYLCYRNFDKLFIGRFFGMDILGYYEKSYRLMMLPLENVSSIISPILHPLLSDYQDNIEQIWNVYIKMLRQISELCFILSVTMWSVAHPIVIILFGPNWESSVLYLKILSLSIGFQILQAPIGAVLQSINKVKALFFGSLWILLFVLFSILISILSDSVIMLSICIVLSFLLGFISYQYYISKFFSKNIWRIFEILYKDLLFALGLAVLLALFPFVVNECSSGIELLLKVVITAFFSISVYFSGFMPETKAIINDLKSRKNEFKM